jgi:signal transduction histidine kinase
VSLHKSIAEKEEAKQYIHLEERSLDKLDKFIQDLLAYSRVNRLEAEFEEVDLASLLTDIIQQIAFYHEASQFAQNQQNKKKVEITLACELSSPFFSDKTKLQIVLQNLISNAVHYADLGKENPFCKVNVSQSQTKTVIEISDNGVGIDPRHNAKIFDMFYRGNTNSKGSGLGLYIVKEATDKMKGQIHFHSVLNEGSTFVLELPNVEQAKT